MIKIRANKLLLLPIMGAVVYLFIGLLYSAASLYCYNVRNWDVYGGFRCRHSSVPSVSSLTSFFGPCTCGPTASMASGSLGSVHRCSLTAEARWEEAVSRDGTSAGSCVRPRAIRVV